MLRLEMHPHQIGLGETLDRAAETTAICWPRRSGKTTGVWSWMLGRCETVPGSQWITTAQTGIKARDRFMAVARQLERFHPQEAGGPRIFRGAGHEAFEWKNGSRLSVVAPKTEAFRGEGASIYVDEPQEFEPAHSEDLRQAVMPLLDTLPDGQVILSGTAGKRRAGWFWHALEAGRSGAPGYALSEYAAPGTADPDDEATWLAAHPGIGTLTTLERMRSRRAGMSLPQWSMEYLSWWPPDAGESAIDQAAWAAARVDTVPLPERFAIAYDVAPDGSSAALMAAWRDEDGNGYLGVLEHRQGVSWLASTACRVAAKHRLRRVRWDSIGANYGPASDIERMRGTKPNAVGSSQKETQAAAQKLVSDLTEGRLRHFGQASLDAAAAGASWRQTDGGRYFGRRSSTADVSPLVGGSLALWEFDQMPAKQSLQIVSTASRRAS